MRSSVLRLPAKGTLVIGTDLQGNLRDFEQLHRRFTALGSDAHLVLTGDLVHGPDEETVKQWPDFLGTPYRDESPALIDALVEAQRAAPGRVHCLMGNHDHSHLGGPVTQKFHDDEPATLEAALGEEGTARWRALAAGFPLVAIAPCGVVMSHAAPGLELDTPEQLEGVPWDAYRGDSIEVFIRRPILGPLLWARSAKDEVVASFLRVLGGTVAVFGHDVVREGFVRDGAQQVCVSTSFGLLDEDKVFVQVELAGRYADAAALREGEELRKLY
ncbi:MAG: metallophosphoesterase [Archangium sp.]|nr:metallophosphoesterase [Archangium sp.]